MARLTRDQHGRPAAPVRILHLGLGNFFRAHTAWYTENAPDAAEWGIAAFSGRSVGLSDDMAAQEGLYTLVTQRPEGDQCEVISTVSATHAGTDLDAFLDYFRSSDLAIVTSTITEAGYLRGGDGALDAEHPGVRADVEALRAGEVRSVTTAPGKFVAGLLARREAGAGPITFCPCDNLPHSGEVVERVVRDLAGLVDPSLTAYIDENVGFVTTMVDRITPRPTPEVRDAAQQQLGVDDPTAVGTEPFAQWVLAGDFKAGRPAWDAAGAEFVDDIAPYEMLKLWLLNGSHSLMAYAGPILGKETVYEAMTDERIAGWVNEWWDVAQRHLPLPEETITAYRAALTERFENPKIRHLLAQIAADGSVKIPVRIVPALNAEREAGGDPRGGERVIAAWICHLRGMGAPVNDAAGDKITGLVAGPLEDAVAAVCDHLGIADADSRASIQTLAEELSASA